MSRARATALCGVSLLLFLVIGGSPAAAHTDLEDTTPTTGARLDTAPSEIELTFSENISPDFVQVSLTRDARPAVELIALVRGPLVVAEVPPSDTDDGSKQVPWRVTYRVVSADGHPITGSMEFSAPSEATPSDRAPQTDEPSPAASALPSPPGTPTPSPTEQSPPTGADTGLTSTGPSFTPTGRKVFGSLAALALLGTVITIGVVAWRRKRDETS